MFENNPKKRVIALGFFDGVHKGHQALMNMAIRRAKEENAISSVFTFDKRPGSVLQGAKVPLLISPSERNEEIRRLGGVDEVIISHFQEMREIPWQTFVSDILVKKFHACHIVSGWNNRFGYMGQGTAEKLGEECARLGIGYDCIPGVKVDGVVVSSTYIRSLIAAGEMDRAQKFLGHPYTISGEVKHGRSIGRTIGVPTVNLSLPEEMQQPPFGVYASKVWVEGKEHLAVTNIGVRPTFEDKGEATIEPHILNFNGDLYGKYIRVMLYHFLRPEMRFDSIEDLKTAIGKDIQATEDYFAGK
jgi:riboflavin kinase/FMN adenylyltransferase